MTDDFNSSQIIHQYFEFYILYSPFFKFASCKLLKQQKDIESLTIGF